MVIPCAIKLISLSLPSTWLFILFFPQSGANALKISLLSLFFVYLSNAALNLIINLFVDLIITSTYIAMNLYDFFFSSVSNNFNKITLFHFKRKSSSSFRCLTSLMNFVNFFSFSRSLLSYSRKIKEIKTKHLRKELTSRARVREKERIGHSWERNT